jgi:AcrR family transcriptional regulator
MVFAERGACASLHQPVSTMEPQRSSGAMRRSSRAEKVSRTRRTILEAAASIVGESGCSEVSIINITRRADIALGTFYNYFKSKQDLLDELLPWAGGSIRAELDEKVRDVQDYAEYEIRNFDGILAFQSAHPYFFRLLSECEVATPESYRSHIAKSIERYHRALEAAWKRGELPTYRRAELGNVAMMLVSTKMLLFMRLGTDKDSKIPELRRSYLRFAFQALFADEAAKYLPRIDRRG